MSDQNQNPNPKLIRKSSVSQALPPNPEIPAHTHHLHVSDTTMHEFNKTVEIKDAEAVAEAGELIQKLRKFRFWITTVIYAAMALVMVGGLALCFWRTSNLAASIISAVVSLAGFGVGTVVLKRFRMSQQACWNTMFHRLFTLYKTYAKVREAVDEQLPTFPRLWQAIETAKEKKKRPT